MSNTNSLSKNSAKKISCGGFMLGEGLTVENEVLSVEYDTWLYLIGNYNNDSTSSSFRRLEMTDVCVTDAEKNILFEYTVEKSTDANKSLKQAIDWMGEHNRLGNFGVAVTTSKNSLLTGMAPVYPLTKIKTRDTTKLQGNMVYNDINYRFVHPVWQDFNLSANDKGYSKIEIQIYLKNYYKQSEAKDDKNWRFLSAVMGVFIIPMWQKSST